nr:hypothetical protein [Kutzneria sp. 744]
MSRNGNRLASSSPAPHTSCTPASSQPAMPVVNSSDLPMPGSPSTSSTPPRPPPTSRTAWRSTESSWVRATKVRARGRGREAHHAGRRRTGAGAATVGAARAGSLVRICCWISANRAPGTVPSSSINTRAAARNCSTASACRPTRYSAIISSPRRPSCSGFSRTSAVSSATSSAC